MKKLMVFGLWINFFRCCCCYGLSTESNGYVWEYSVDADKKIWTVWDGTTEITSGNIDGIYEMYFRYKNMSKEDGDFYLDVLRHSKEITDSAYGYKPQYDIVEMSLMSTENGIRFNGSITNGMENRYITGTMISRLNKTFVDISVERLLGDIPNREYNAVEVFKFKRDEVERRTCYSNGEYYESILEPFEQEKMEEYKLSKIHKNWND